MFCTEYSHFIIEKKKQKKTLYGSVNLSISSTGTSVEATPSNPVYSRVPFVELVLYAGTPTAIIKRGGKFSTFFPFSGV